MWAGLAGTAAVHLAAIAFVLFSLTPTSRTGPPTYAVELVAAPAAAASARPTAASRATSVTPPAPKAVAKPAPVKPKVTAKADNRTRAGSPVTPLPGETPGTGSDIANVDLKGKAFPYPEYLRNLVAQIYRRWNRPSGNSSLTAEIGFVILRDGTVKDIRVASSSRSYSFDLEASGAVESAALAKAFGPLPAGYGADYLQISFLFTPRRP